MQRHDPQQRAPSDPDAMPSDPEAVPGAAEPTSRDALRGLEERLDRASAAAQRLVREAAHQAASPGAHPQNSPPSGPASSEPPSDRASSEPPPDRASSEPPPSGTGRPPPAGWQTPPAHGRPAGRSGVGEIQLLLGAVKSLRELIPPDLQRRLAQALRELLLAIQALIDWYLERLEQHPAEPAEVQDIPIL
ncbi:MAG: hypothetical protein ACR2LV_10385 [Solirubrobacteraceae bacterium]